jgi:hypothetical protein
VVPPSDVSAGAHGSHEATAAGSEQSEQLRGVLAYVEARADSVQVRLLNPRLMLSFISIVSWTLTRLNLLELQTRPRDVCGRKR